MVRNRFSESTPAPADRPAILGAFGGNKLLILRLSAMMLLEFVVWGSWYATLGLVLAANGLPGIIGTAYAAGAVAAIVSPLCFGAVGDRVLPSEKLLGILLLVGGGLMLCLTAIVKAQNANLVLLMIFIYMVTFLPTLGLTTSIALRHLAFNQQIYPYVRVFGTFGWALAGTFVGALGFSASRGLFEIAGFTSLFFGIYAFTLPLTPPGAKNVRFSIGDLIGAKAFVLLRHRNFAVLMVCALLTAISLGFYNSYTSPYLRVLGISNVAGVMALGQVSEVLCIITIPFVLSRIGMKWGLLLGMGMWGIRFSLFALASGGHIWMAVLGVVLHGICNDFFLILSAMYIDQVVPIDLHAQAQNGLVLVINGPGIGIGAIIAGAIFRAAVVGHPNAGPKGWLAMWLVPIGSAFITAIIWTSLFRYSRRQKLVRLDLNSTA
jgi:nucleoside transporter